MARAKRTAPAGQGAVTGDGKGAALPEIEPTHITVRAVSDAGFRRAGRFWPAAETTVSLDELAAEQVEALLCEPELDCVFVVADEAAERSE